MAIFIGKEIYLGRKPQEKGELPLGFATYKEDNKAFEKRKDTIETWVSGYSWRNTEGTSLESIVLDNELVKGFKIADAVQRCGYGGSGNVVWRIADPRGFELEISSANMASIMADCTLYRGTIDTPCIWAWNKSGGSRIMLLPEGSEPFNDAMEDTKRTNTTVAAKDIDIGDTVELKNGTTGVYMGRFHSLHTDYESGENNGGHGYPWYNEHRSQGYTVKPVLRSVIKFVTDNDDKRTALMFVSKLNVSNIIEKASSPLTKEESATIINNHIKEGILTGDGFMSNYGYYDGGWYAVFADKVKADDLTVTLGGNVNPKELKKKEYKDGTPNYFFGMNGEVMMAFDTDYLRNEPSCHGGQRALLRTVAPDCWNNKIISFKELPQRRWVNSFNEPTYHSDEDRPMADEIQWQLACVKYKDELYPIKL